MQSTLVSNRRVSAHFSGHETFPLRQMWLKKVVDQSTDDGLIPKSIFTNKDAIATFGVGKNMVSSIRHWALACGIIEEASTKEFVLTKLALSILSDNGVDPYAEHASTAWLVHWHLAGKCLRSTTWYWLFNHVTIPAFTRKDLESVLATYAQELVPEHRLSLSTLERDLEVCLRSYAPRSSAGTPEDYAEPLLGEIGLLQEIHKGQYAFRRGPKASLHKGIFAYALLDFWEQDADGLSALAFENIIYTEGSPGRVFKLDEESVSQYLMDISEFSDGIFVWTDSAGLRQIHRKMLTKTEQEAFKEKMIRWAYEE
ncbi:MULTISPECIES: DUF4007 family protein [Enterobacteriaceae]|uniref:DUF4007 family protein n=1 Tax=Enterobacteriaceae TaxID=543 RepID=UPI001D079819|nr:MULTISPECIES: DUF4007 family protein [Enterobacteriaceae]EKT9192158.1 DUF4007 family protein [Enterobacter cloacae]MDT7423675.1 DUF4007 family protein [Citrobacter freundii]HDQ2810110.1 DUF4007 family protein [Citrobacter amalonaticus]